MNPVVIHRHVVVLPDGSEQSAKVVHCPDRQATVSCQACMACGRSRGFVVDPRIQREVVECSLAPLSETSIIPAHARRAAGDPLGGAEVAAAMSRDVICATAETPVDEVRRTMRERALGAVVVVDGGHRPIGLLSASDLGTTPCGAARAGEAATRPIAVGHRGSLTRAAAIMAFEGAHHLVVVDDDGRLEGILSTLDLLRYLGQAGGALLPDPPAWGPARPVLEEDA